MTDTAKVHTAMTIAGSDSDGVDLDDDTTSERLAKRMAELMRECDAPADQFERLGLTS